MNYYHYAHSLAYQDTYVDEEGQRWLLPSRQGDFHKHLLLVTLSEEPIFCDLAERAIWTKREPTTWRKIKVKSKGPLLRFHFSHPTWVPFLEQCRNLGLEINKLYWTLHKLPASPSTSFIGF